MDNPTVRMIVDTPKDSRIKYKLEESSGGYIVDRILVPGLCFPFNFGFVPKTKAADGDPVDMILVCNASLPVGCAVDCAILGVIEAEQTEGGETYRNDRVIAISLKDGDAPQSLDQLPKDFVENVERFFSTYHQAEGNEFKVLQLNDAEEALGLIERAALTQNGRKSHRS
ncbi:MAG TPA: inorganic diphosphatase [Candidatus Binataceae bacterium]|nr:inorganic diphosphatase [Candidatus Binataceae bacterium]